jgi:Protein of unknown function (DUF998)
MAPPARARAGAGPGSPAGCGCGCCAVPGGGLRPGRRGLNSGEDREVPVQPGDAQHPAGRRRNRGQVHETAEQPGPARGADQHREPAGVTEAHPGQVDNKPAGTGPEQAQKLVAQGSGAGNVEFAGQLGNGDADRLGAANGGACSTPMVVVVRVPWWGVVSSATAPVLLAGGWIVAAGLQPRPINPVASTISALAADGATDRWVMTLVLLAVGVCDALTGLALRPAGLPGRLILIAGGTAGVLVAATPEPARGGSAAHAFWAAIGFIALTLWPLGSQRRGPSVPAGLRPAVSAVAAGALLALLGWFAVELMTRGGQVGLAERVLTEAQAVWPLAVVLTCWRNIPPVRGHTLGSATQAA